MRQVRIASDDVEVVVLPEAGARLHRLRALGADLLWSPDQPEDHLAEPFFGGAYVMAPWANRIAAGRTFAGDRELSLEPSFDDGSAIHGLVYAKSWRDAGAGRFEVEAGGPDPRGPADGWPWRFRVRLVVATPADGAVAELTVSLTNLDDVAMPAGLGLHPWFRRPLEVAIHGDRVYPRTDASEPAPVPVAGELDLRRLREPPIDVDAAWTDLRGHPTAELAWPTLGVKAALHASAVLHGTASPDGSRPVLVVAASSRMRPAVAVEPQTHAPQGLRRLLGGEPDPMAWLEPGQTLELRTRLLFGRAVVRGVS